MSSPSTFCLSFVSSLCFLSPTELPSMKRVLVPCSLILHGDSTAKDNCLKQSHGLPVCCGRHPSHYQTHLTQKYITKHCNRKIEFSLNKYYRFSSQMIRIDVSIFYWPPRSLKSSNLRFTEGNKYLNIYISLRLCLPQSVVFCHYLFISRPEFYSYLHHIIISVSCCNKSLPILWEMR